MAAFQDDTMNGQGRGRTYAYPIFFFTKFLNFTKMVNFLWNFCELDENFRCSGTG
jgi:hypothetical protein